MRHASQDMKPRSKTVKTPYIGAKFAAKAREECDTCGRWSGRCSKWTDPRQAFVRTGETRCSLWIRRFV